ncbi:MAG: bifunctional tetrahydrofolate synthase/dihydrofolate synthase [Burkholderiaceae bacterium]|nr:MAG: bifunctional tetrahydrofolate synthase/dihydrofolate synthase [Burkholderiaceae bacterium]
MSSPQSLTAWLTLIESLHPKSIEMGLERVRAIKEKLGVQFSCPVITVGGTNGKGSTCAMLEAILLQAGYRVGCYTSPHLLHFNERARINGAPASDAALCEQFAAVEAARGTVSLTYFEFTTLAILRLFQHEALDVVILEVGLGGRLDAVNIVDADCSIVTSVDLDHMDYLGATREQIGWEKAHIYRAGKPAICCDPAPPSSLVQQAQKIGADLWLFGRDFNYSGDKQQWNYGGRHQRRHSLAYPALRGVNQLLNASGALAVLEALQQRLPVSQQAVRQGLAQVELPGRFQTLAGRPTVILDVAHNPHAAAVLAQNLDSMGFYANTHAVFGMLNDKDIGGVVQQLAGAIDHWHLASLEGPRGTRAEQLQSILAAQGLVAQAPDKSGLHGRTIQCYDSPAQAFARARECAHENDRILVFGSFHTVAEIMATNKS